jgi:hypothetical protein
MVLCRLLIVGIFVQLPDFGILKKSGLSGDPADDVAVIAIEYAQFKKVVPDKPDSRFQHQG